MVAKDTQVFISRVVGLPIVDAAGDQVGRVKDVVCHLRADGKAPRVKGLVVELFARARIFVPMVRVHGIAPTHVAILGQVDTRRFKRRETEILIAADLLNRVIGNDRRTRIADISMHQVRNREWELSSAALRSTTRVGRFGLGGRNEARVASWREIPELILRTGRTPAHLIAEFSEMKAADIAQELHDMEPESLAAVVEALDDETLAEALEELPEHEQIELISALDTDRAADVLAEMDPDDAADLIKDLPSDVAEDLLQRMEPEEALDVRRLLMYEEFTAGGMMTPEPVILDTDATVAQALANVRIDSLTPALASMVFVTRPPLETPSGRYIGAVHIQRLLREPPTTLVATLLDEGLEPLPPDAPLALVSRFFATYNLVVAPVVNAEGHLVGAVTVDDVLDHMLPDDWRGDQMDEIDADEFDEVSRG
ncbi:magnesium transporter MgtE N-terminal domain-containing protein [Tessaracoccus defluvii]|uniref:PRC-barrel domain-containing protein n=1 Tax=Tessaracoccus defluvii TaxID=1285901 RepID=A0A7H0HA14_9ACTN|nr:PRC-barrel domain-containing protein [Tessaracoccus defluvii]QNP57380.1 PRC-barrel domain-containing protein [Tessaracoccus defluvii]